MKATLWFDLDGVLADFFSWALSYHGAKMPIMDVQWDFCTQIGFNGSKDPRFWDPLGYDFWVSLPVYPDGLCLLKAAERKYGAANIGFLTTPCQTHGCMDGKREWVARHFPDYVPRLFMGEEKEMHAGPGKILVDDRDVNCDRFISRGGGAIIIPRPWNRYKAYCASDASFDVPSTFSALTMTVESSLSNA